MKLTTRPARPTRTPEPTPPHKELKPPLEPVVDAPAGFTREQLSQKFQQVRRDYDLYKSRFGSALEREWGELATFIQYMSPNADDEEYREAARRLDAFRARMRG